MGYFVDGICVSSIEHAEALYFSKVVPIVTENGLLQVQFYEGQYFLNSQPLTATFAQCNPVQSFISGASLGLIVGLFFAVAYGFIAMKRVI